LGRLAKRVPNVWPNFSGMLYVRMKQRLLMVSALSIKWPGNVIVSKHMSVHASFEMANYVEKL